MNTALLITALFIKVDTHVSFSKHDQIWCLEKFELNLYFTVLLWPCPIHIDLALKDAYNLTISWSLECVDYGSCSYSRWRWDPGAGWPIWWVLLKYTKWNIKLTSAAVWIEYLPPYSPDLNPIEEAFSKIKAFIRRNNDVFLSAPSEAIMYDMYIAMEVITKCDEIGYFVHAGYF